MMTRQEVHELSIEALRRAGVWDDKRGKAENMEALRAHRERLLKRAGVCNVEGSKAWAQELVARYRDGECIPPAHLKLAFDALGLKEEPILKRLPPQSGPDAKERAAGDVERPGPAAGDFMQVVW